ncbi:MAG: hypothetical protein ABJB69_05665 [Spartobacteria bacterium]
MSEENKEQTPAKPDKPEMKDLQPEKDPKAGGSKSIQPIVSEQ